MYQVILNEGSSVEELATAYSFFERKRAEIVSALADCRARLVELQLQRMGGENVAKVLKEAKSLFEDLSLEVEACSDGQAKAKSRMADAIRKRHEARIQEIDGETAAMMEDIKALNREYLTACAQAALLYQKLKGPRVSCPGTSGFFYQLPQPDLSFLRSGGDDITYYLREFERLSGSPLPGPKDCPSQYRGLEDRRWDLCREKNALQERLEAFDSEQEIEPFLRAAGSPSYAPAVDETAPEDGEESAVA